MSIRQSPTTTPKRPYKAIQAKIPDWNDYDTEAKKLSAQFGVPVSVPHFLRMAVDFWKANRSSTK